MRLVQTHRLPLAGFRRRRTGAEGVKGIVDLPRDGLSLGRDGTKLAAFSGDGVERLLCSLSGGDQIAQGVFPRPLGWGFMIGVHQSFSERSEFCRVFTIFDKERGFMAGGEGGLKLLGDLRRMVCKIVNRRMSGAISVTRNRIAAAADTAF
ncbi:hypothetical protein D3C86_1063620 [compost metagenome]